jgi:hypothetical protein
MRILKFSMVVALVLAIVGPAQAIVLLQPYTGPVTMKFRNWDTGTLYIDQDGTTVGEANMDTLATVPGFPPDSFGVGEDSWGVVQLTEIWGAQNQMLWSGAIPGTPEITGLFWGERDTYLDQDSSGVGVIQKIHGIGFKIAFYEDANNDLGNPPGAYGGSGNVGTDRRTSEAVFEGATEGNLLWTGNSVPGFNALFPNDEFFTDFSPSGAVAAWGGLNAFGGMFVDLGTVYTDGADGAPGVVGVDDDGNGVVDDIGERGFAGSDDVAMLGSGNNLFDTSEPVDWRIAFTGKPDGTGEFLVLSDDPIDTIIVIPEPITMFGMLLGVGGIARYVRRRRR